MRSMVDGFCWILAIQTCLLVMRKRWGFPFEILTRLCFPMGITTIPVGLGHLIQYFDRSDRSTERRIQLIAHPDAFVPKYHGDKVIGANFPADCYENYLDKVVTKDPYRLTENLLFLGRSPAVTILKRRGQSAR